MWFGKICRRSQNEQKRKRKLLQNKNVTSIRPLLPSFPSLSIFPPRILSLHVYFFYIYPSFLRFIFFFFCFAFSSRALLSSFCEQNPHQQMIDVHVPNRFGGHFTLFSVIWKSSRNQCRFYSHQDQVNVIIPVILTFMSCFSFSFVLYSVASPPLPLFLQLKKQL